MRPYTISDSDFAAWLDSGPSEDELREAIVVLTAKQEFLWEPGHHDSYYRDRFERHERYERRISLVRGALVDTYGDLEVA